MTSEYVTIGHPDKVADYISEYMLDRYMEQDRSTRYAVEVQIKDNWVSLAGEVTSSAKFSAADRAEFVRRAVEEIGYTHEYASQWPDGCTLDASKIEVEEHLSEQSRDISKGVDNDGWGDQGIFWGMAVPDRKHCFMPLDCWYAKKIGDFLFEKRFGGLDIKTQVAVENGEAVQCIAAVPMLPECAESASGAVRSYIQSVLGQKCKLVVNGTGSYVKHSSFGDCGTTGRNPVVGFYGGNCRIGGGSPWTKDPSKADLTLNLYARKLAVDFAMKTGTACYVSISCCIGQKDIDICTYDSSMHVLERRTESFGCKKTAELCGLRGGNVKFADLCKNGLMYSFL